MDQPTWIVAREHLLELCRDLRDNPKTRFDMLLDLCGVDYPDRSDEAGGRFEAVYHLYSMPRGERLRLKVPITEADPVLPSLISVWKAAARGMSVSQYVADLLAIQAGHPELVRELDKEVLPLAM